MMAQSLLELPVTWIATILVRHGILLKGSLRSNATKSNDKEEGVICTFDLSENVTILLLSSKWAFVHGFAPSCLFIDNHAT